MQAQRCMDERRVVNQERTRASSAKVKRTVSPLALMSRWLPSGAAQNTPASATCVECSTTLRWLINGKHTAGRDARRGCKGCAWAVVTGRLADVLARPSTRLAAADAAASRRRYRLDYSWPSREHTRCSSFNIQVTGNTSS